MFDIGISDISAMFDIGISYISAKCGISDIRCIPAMCGISIFPLCSISVSPISPLSEVSPISPIMVIRVYGTSIM